MCNINYMKTVIMIPARYASQRFEGKPLAMLTGPDGTQQTLIERSWRAACAVPDTAGVYVVTDDDRIAQTSRSFGADVIMTDPSCENGTARVAQAMERAQIEADVIVNLQGDAPLTPRWFVTALMDAMAADPTIQMATPVLRCDATTLDYFYADRKNDKVGGTTAVMDHQGRALYFSKEVIPYIVPGQVPDPVPVFHHVGVYAYRPEALAAYGRWPMGPLETLEGLEQLRFLENGTPVTCVEVESHGRLFWELNNPPDVARIEAAMIENAQHDPI